MGQETIPNKAGNFGRFSCGWCNVHKQPVYLCNCDKIDNLKCTCEFPSVKRYVNGEWVCIKCCQ